MSKSRNTSPDRDYGRHVTELRRRARRPDLKDRRGRDNERRAAIERSTRNA